MRFCYQCQKDREDTEFFPSFIAKKNAHIGLCKDCGREWQRAYLKALQEDPVRHAAALELKRQRRARNAEHYRRKRREQYHKNPTPEREANSRWHKNNPDKNVMKANRRRARVFGLQGQHTQKEWERLLIRYGNQCLRCGKTDVRLTRDHVTPVIKQGRNSIDNIQPLCKPCNAHKKDRAFDYRVEYHLDW